MLLHCFESAVARAFFTQFRMMSVEDRCPASLATQCTMIFDGRSPAATELSLYDFFAGSEDLVSATTSNRHSRAHDKRQPGVRRCAERLRLYVAYVAGKYRDFHGSRFGGGALHPTAIARRSSYTPFTLLLRWRRTLNQAAGRSSRFPMNSAHGVKPTSHGTRATDEQSCGHCMMTALSPRTWPGVATSSGESLPLGEAMRRSTSPEYRVYTPAGASPSRKSISPAFLCCRVSDDCSGASIRVVFTEPIVRPSEARVR